MKLWQLFRSRTAKFNPSKDSNGDSGCHQWGCRNIPYRYVTAIYGFLTMTVLNVQRMNISIAILKMANSTLEVIEQNVTEYCPHPDLVNDTGVVQHDGEFNWSPDIQGYVMAAGHFGYLIPQIAAGRMAERFGAKPVLIVGLLCSSFCIMISPVAARLDVVWLIAVQAIKGIALGVFAPSMSCITASWFPRQESQFLLTFVQAGTAFGCFLGVFLSGFLCDLSFLGGWPLAFYVCGAIGCVLCVFLVLFFYDSPQTHPHIQESEKKYLLAETGKSISSRKLRVPWTQLLFSTPSLVLYYASFGQYWITFYYATSHSLYLGNILHYPISKTGTLASVPFLLQAAVGIGASYLSDIIRRRKQVSVDFTRKVNNSISTIVFTITMVGIYFAGCDELINVSCFLIGMAFSGFATPGCITAPVDMSPNFAGTLMGVTSSLASTSGFIIPIIVGDFTKDEQSIYQWQKVFLTSIIVVFSSGVVFQFFGSADVQPWNDSEEHKTDENIKVEEPKNGDNVPSINHM